MKGFQKITDVHGTSWHHRSHQVTQLMVAGVSNQPTHVRVHIDVSDIITHMDIVYMHVYVQFANSISMYMYTVSLTSFNTDTFVSRVCNVSVSRSGMYINSSLVTTTFLLLPENLCTAVSFKTILLGAYRIQNYKLPSHHRNRDEGLPGHPCTC